MPKRQITTQADINFAIEAIMSILTNIVEEEVQGVCELAVEGRYREKELDVDISDSESDCEDRDDTWSENGSTSEEDYPSPQAC